MDAMKVVMFSLDVEDKPGVLAGFCRAMRDRRVDMKGLWAFGRGDGKAQILLVPETPTKFKEAARVHGYAAKEGTAFYVTGKDQIGALCKSLEAAEKAGVNIHAADAIGVGGKFGAYLWAEEQNAAALGRALGAN